MKPVLADIAAAQRLHCHYCVPSPRHSYRGTLPPHCQGFSQVPPSLYVMQLGNELGPLLLPAELPISRGVAIYLEAITYDGISVNHPVSAGFVKLDWLLRPAPLLTERCEH